MVKNKEVKKITANDLDITDITPNIDLNKLYVPEKEKETVYIDGSPDEVANKLVDVFRNDMKILN